MRTYEIDTVGNSMQPLVTVVIPTFNSNSTIARAVASVQEQNYKNIEILIVDDGSTDGTADVVRELAKSDQRIVQVNHTLNRGRSAARNTGVHLARGVLVAFLDSDDEWSPHKLSLQVDVWRSAPDRRHTVVYCAYDLRLPRKRHREKPAHAIKPGQRIASYLFCAGGLMQTSGLLVPTFMARETQFPTELNQYEDYAFLFGLEKLGSTFIFVDSALVTVHWEELETRRTGPWDANGAIQFCEKWAYHFNEETTACFKFESTVLAALQVGLGIRGALAYRHNVRWRLLRARHWAALLKWLVMEIGS